MKLQALYDSESAIVKALPKMAKKANEQELKDLYKHHLGETKGQLERLEEAFKLLNEKPKKLKGDAIRGLIMDAEWLIKNVDDQNARDAAMIGASQSVEHYEMAGYGTAIEWAKLLGYREIVSLLKETLGEEEETDKELSKLAEKKINERAMQGEME